MKRKLLILMFATMLTFTLVACGENAGVSSNSQSENAVSDNDTASVSKDVIDNSEDSKADDASGENADAEPSTDIEVTEKISLEPKVLINGTVVELGSDMFALKDSLGATDSYEEADSCLGAGKDRVYYYGPYIIYTMPDGDKDGVNEIAISKGGKLMSGIVVGESTKDDVLSVYGDMAKAEGSYIVCESQEGVIIFDFDGDVVSEVDMGRN